MSDISELIRTSRKAKGLSRNQLADITGISLTTLKNYEVGTFEPTYSKLKIILNEIDVEIIFKKKERKK